MFNALAVRDKHLQLILVVAIEMVLERFPANRARYDIAPILAFEHDNVSHGVFSGVGIRKYKRAFVEQWRARQRYLGRPEYPAASRKASASKTLPSTMTMRV